MGIIHIITGIFMIGVGFLIKSFPNLIAGYNTMSEDKKKHVDIEGLSTFMRNSFIIIGLSIITGYYVFKWLGCSAIANSMILIATIIGMIIMLIYAQRFDHNKTNTKNKIHLFYSWSCNGFSSRTHDVWIHSIKSTNHQRSYQIYRDVRIYTACF